LHRITTFSPVQLEDVFARIAQNVVKLEYFNSFIDLRMIQLINSLSNLEVLLLIGIEDARQVWFLQELHLKLPKLRKLAIECCSFGIFKLLNQLHDDTLDELSLRSIKGSSMIDAKLFENQRNIKFLDLYQVDLDVLNFQQLKLERVSLENLDEHTLKYWKGQDKIVDAKFDHHKEKSSLDLKELKSLEVLNVHSSKSHALIDLSSNLNIRRVVIEYDFAAIKSETLQELIYENGCNSKEKLEEIARNCPNLRTLQVDLADIDSIFILFPKLESLCCYRVSRFTQNSDHKHLKKLCVWKTIVHDHLQTDSNIIKIVRRCLNLESLEFHYDLFEETVEKLLRSAPRLKALSLRGHAKDYVKVIKEFGGHLDCFRCLSDHPSQKKSELAKHELKYQFNEFTVEKYVFIAKKKGSEGKFWKGSEMNV
jgi:hypothetical protein